MRNSGLSVFAASSLAVFAYGSDAAASIVDISGVPRTGDFDGDGIVETVVSSPETNCGKGAVYVVDADGDLTAWTRDTTGVLGTAACDDLFGASLAVADFNGDGYDDLAIAAPGANDTGFTASGSVHVLYGSSTGLTETGDQLWTLDTPQIDGTAQANDHFGDALTAGDFNCDGEDDLAVGSPRKGNGAVNVILGSTGGLTAVSDRLISGTSGSFGAALVAGNFNGDQVSGVGCDDLVIAAPNETVGTATNAGSLRRYAGGTAGLASAVTQTIHQNSTNVEDTAEGSDRFGWRLAVAHIDSDAYDDLLVAVPGDGCASSVGTGQHRFFGSSTGLATSNDVVACDTYACSVYDDRILACHAGSLTVYGTTTNEVISLGSSTGIAKGGDGNDEIHGDRGDDRIFGGAGNDSIEGGPGRDIIIAGSGDDTIYIDLDCMVMDGEVVDGGPGTDTIRSHLTQLQLQALGLTIASVEQFVLIAENPDGASVCDPTPVDDGPFVRPSVSVTWTNLTTPSSVHYSSTGYLLLQLKNTSADIVLADLEFALRVRGEEVRIEEGPVTVAAGGSASVTLDLNDFVPTGTNTSSVDPALLVLPVSASITARARLTVSSAHVGYSFAPTIYGHLQTGSAGDVAVLYREGALHDTYYHGDLARWRASATPYTGAAKLMGRIEAHGSLGIPGY